MRHRSSFLYQTGILALRNAEILFNSTGKLILLVALPIVSGLIVGIAAGSNMFSSFSDSQTGYFVLCCAMVFTGVFNSIQEVCRERNILKREYCANLRLSSYVCGKLCVQAVICAVQAILLMLVFCMFADYSKNAEGLIMPAFLEAFITLFLLNLASDATGLFLSSLVRTADIANIIAPVFLILQVVFSGVLFPLNGIFKPISHFMVGHWAIEALGSSADIAAELREKQVMATSIGKSITPQQSDIIDMYKPGIGFLLTAWGALAGFVLFFSFLCVLVLKRVARDTR